MDSVKSAYKALASAARLQTQYAEEFACPSFGEANPIWKKLWKLAAPPKIKCFWWRVLKGFMPVRDTLHKRHMENQSICAECGAKDETIFHALIECTFARMFWSAFRDLSNIKLPLLHPLTWAGDILNSSICPASDVCAILRAMWSIWTARNKRRHGEISLNIPKACRWAMDTAADLISSSKASSVVATREPPPCWSPPPAGCLKINVDAAFFSNTLSGASGCVLRDYSGTFLQASSLWYGYVPDALTAEAFAVRDGVLLCSGRNDMRIILETDCQVLIELWKTRKKNRAAVLPILNEIEELSGEFFSFEICYVNRDANFAAHITAKQASCLQPKCAWASQVPVFLSQCIQHDIQNVG